MYIVSAEPEVAEYDELQDGLFGDLVRGLTEIPPIPYDLRRYDVAITRAEARDEGKKVFLFWLREQLGIRDEVVWRSGRFACGEAPDLFFLNWPTPDDFELGEADLEYLRADRLVTINQAAARQVCDDCPLRSMCLARNITGWRASYAERGAIDTGVEDPEFNNEPTGKSTATIKIVPSEEHVVGGWGLLARTTIANRYTELRRAFEGGCREEREKEPIGTGGMDAAEREHYISEARQLKVREW